MPDNFDDEQIDNMSIDEINKFFKDVVEGPDEVKISIYDRTPAMYGACK